MEFIHPSAVLENVAKTNREFAYKVKLGALTKGSKIVAEGYFSGLNAGVSWINLETDDRDTVFRLALRSSVTYNCWELQGKLLNTQHCFVLLYLNLVLKVVKSPSSSPLETFEIVKKA